MSLTYSSKLTGSNLTLGCEGTEQTHFWLLNRFSPTYFAICVSDEFQMYLIKIITHLKRFDEYTEQTSVPCKFKNIPFQSFHILLYMTNGTILRPKVLFPLNKALMVGLLMCIVCVFKNVWFFYTVSTACTTLDTFH